MNGDGRRFVIPESPEGEVGVAGRQLVTAASPPGYEGPEDFRLNDGTVAMLYLDRMGDAVEFYVTLSDQDASAQYQFFALVTSHFYEANERLLKDIARTLRGPRSEAEGLNKPLSRRHRRRPDVSPRAGAIRTPRPGRSR